jgi:arylsulfatase A-like enzyme
MLRREFLQSIAGAALQAGRPAARPNVLVILSDDQGIGDVGCFGAADVRTPNLDRLAAAGVRFTNWHASSPVCSPSRASVLTGKYPQRAGIPQILFSKPNFDVPGLKRGEHTLASELKALGYRTAAIGKWHLGSAPDSRPLAQGFDEFFGFYSGWIDYYSHRFYTLGGQPIFHDLWRNDREVWEEPAYQTELLTREAKAFLERQSASRPFFLYLAYGAPHYPMMAPQRYVARFPARMDRDRRLHAASVAALDEGIGAVLDTLDARQLKDTIVYFQSDNGATLEVRADHRGRPYHGGSNGIFRGYKGSLFEGGTRVPAILRWPGHIPAGRVVDALGMAMDVMPTVLKWAGGSPPGGVDGLDISSMVLQGGASPHEAGFWGYDGQSCICEGDWKFLHNPREALDAPPGTEDWLVNLKEDPAERVNRITREPGRAADLRRRLQDWERGLN